VLLGDQPSVSARLQAQVASPTDAAVRVGNYIEATGQRTWDELLFERRQIEAALTRTIGEATASWGVAISAVELELEGQGLH
jgi:hypothetical protein